MVMNYREQGSLFYKSRRVWFRRTQVGFIIRMVLYLTKCYYLKHSIYKGTENTHYL